MKLKLKLEFNSTGSASAGSRWASTLLRLAASAISVVLLVLIR